MKKNRGLSPVIATMLLVAMVVIIGIIIFLWLRGINDEAITKFDGTNIKLVCEEVQFDASYTSPDVYVLNTGNVPIYKMKAKTFNNSQGSHTTEELTGTPPNEWPAYGLSQGGAFSGRVGIADKIILVPVLIGHSEKGDLAYTCDERHGYEIIA